MIRLENGLERKSVVFFSLWHDMGVLQGGLKIKELIIRKSVVTLEWLI